MGMLSWSPVNYIAKSSFWLFFSTKPVPLPSQWPRTCSGTLIYDSSPIFSQDAKDDGHGWPVEIFLFVTGCEKIFCFLYLEQKFYLCPFGITGSTHRACEADEITRSTMEPPLGTAHFSFRWSRGGTITFQVSTKHMPDSSRLGPLLPFPVHGFTLFYHCSLWEFIQEWTQHRASHSQYHLSGQHLSGTIPFKETKPDNIDFSILS